MQNHHTSLWLLLDTLKSLTHRDKLICKDYCYLECYTNPGPAVIENFKTLIQPQVFLSSESAQLHSCTVTHP